MSAKILPISNLKTNWAKMTEEQRWIVYGLFLTMLAPAARRWIIVHPAPVVIGAG